MSTPYSPSGRLALLALALAPAAAGQCPIPIDLNPGPGFSRPAFYENAFGRDLYFALDTASLGTELWKWSPATGVVLVADVKPGSGTSNPNWITACCTAQGPKLLFTAAGTGINGELWSTDVATGTTSQVAEIRPGSSSSVLGNFIVVGNRVMFTGNDGSNGNELWVSDGTGTGTHLVEIRPGALGSNPQDMTALGDTLLFIADDGSGRELWVSDGSSAGTLNLSDLVPTLGLFPYELTTCGDVVFFVGTHSTIGETLWKTDGTAGGTVVVNPALKLDFTKDLTCCGDLLFFSSRLPSNRRLLFVSDGTPSGTVQVQNDPNTWVESPVGFTYSDGRVFFAGFHFQTGTELWVSDGTEAGTMLAADIHPGPQSSALHSLVAAGAGVCFGADDGTNGLEPWFSDGTPPGTFKLCDLNPAGHSSPHDLHVVGGQLFLMATEPSIGTEPHILATPGAHVERLGAGGGPDYPTVRTRDAAPPVLGATIDLVAEGGPTGHVGFLFLGAPGLPAPPLPPFMQGGCDWVGLLAGTGVSVAGTASPSFSLPLPIPNQPVLEGAGVRVQMVWFSPLATPPFQMSNGLQLVLGEAAPH